MFLAYDDLFYAFRSSLESTLLSVKTLTAATHDQYFTTKRCTLRVLSKFQPQLPLQTSF